VRTRRVANIRDYLSPSASVWSQAPVAAVQLMPTPLPMQPTAYIQKSWEGRDYGQTKSLEVASVHDGRHWALRARWEGVSPAGLDFPDALAVAIPLKPAAVLMLMGSPEAPIHYLRWRASKNDLQSQLATGIGKSAPGPQVKTTVQSAAEGGHWTVVISRPLSAGPEVPALKPGARERIGFALWRGSNDERGGIKAFSIDWTAMVLDA
jgi:DMSO reductase family type II enzyme heme b subunit